ncbi:MAG: peroxiredoxin [Bdellovibrionaceae bacterium]|nr:peroxiredoxin [Pseudobdellovibrionaceae bacterium]
MKKTTLNNKNLSITLPATGNKELSLKDFIGKNLVLYFYPKDDTPGCTSEGKDFTRLYKKFQSCHTDIIGVSRDNMSSHEKFKEKYKYSFDLISDSDEKLCRAFDVIKEKNFFGKKIMCIERSTFVLDKKGNIVKEWRKVKVSGHAQEVLDFVKNLP